MPALLAGCGDETVTETGQAPPTSASATTVLVPPTSAAPMRSVVAQFTSNDGYRYNITLSVGAQPAPAKADECPPAAPVVAGTSTLPVALTVRNEAADKPAPFPPLRVELTSGGAVAPQQVLVRSGAAGCTFTPRMASIGPGESVTFRGTSPAIATTAASGSVGKIVVSASETTFSVSAPVP